MTDPVQLTCCICYGDAGVFSQHRNRDTGYGVCRSCVDDEINRGTTPDRLYSLYGEAGKNYEAKTLRTLGRDHKILAEFAASDADAANAYMTKHPGVAVLAVIDGLVILANKDDLGS